jgi:hypothetical protein
VKTAALAWIVLATACSRPAPAVPAASHEHHPPHGGTPVVVGSEAYHLELVAEPSEGALTAYVLDSEMEQFVRIPSLSIEIDVSGRQGRTLILKAVANSATGETEGDTSCFRVQDPWLRSAPSFDATIPGLEIRGTRFGPIGFNLPKGNDAD